MSGLEELRVYLPRQMGQHWFFARTGREHSNGGHFPAEKHLICPASQRQLWQAPTCNWHGARNGNFISQQSQEILYDLMEEKAGESFFFKWLTFHISPSVYVLTESSERQFVLLDDAGEVWAFSMRLESGWPSLFSSCPCSADSVMGHWRQQSTSLGEKQGVGGHSGAAHSTCPEWQVHVRQELNVQISPSTRSVPSDDKQMDTFAGLNEMGDSSTVQFLERERVMDYKSNWKSQQKIEKKWRIDGSIIFLTISKQDERARMCACFKLLKTLIKINSNTQTPSSQNREMKWWASYILLL